MARPAAGHQSLPLVVVTFGVRIVFRKTVESDWRVDIIPLSDEVSPLTLEMTTAQVVETSVTLNSLPED